MFKHIKKIILILITLGLGLSALWMFSMEDRAVGPGQQPFRKKQSLQQLQQETRYQGPYQINQARVINSKDIFDWICGGAVKGEENFRNKLGWNSGKLHINANNPQDLKEDIARYSSQTFNLIAQGDLEFLTVWQLRQCTTNRYYNQGTLDILIHDPKNSNHTDVRALMADQKNNNAVFQVASTPSALEGGMQRYRRLLKEMAHSPVQGETISFATAPATIWRKYYEPTWNQDYHDNQKYYLWHYLLQNKNIYSTNRNNEKYLDYNKLEGAYFNINDINLMGVGIHADVPVITGCGGDIKNNGPQQIILYQNKGQNQKVTLALVSAFNIDKFNKFKNGSRFRQSSNNGCETFAKIALDAAYEGTIQAAIAKGKQRVFLTIMGGGSFRNDIEWIYESIYKIKDLIKSSGLQVTLIYRPDANRKGGLRTNTTDEKFLKQFAGLINYINNNGSDQFSGLDTEIENYCFAAYKGTLTSQLTQQLQRLLDNLAAGQLSQRMLQQPTQQVSPPTYQSNHGQTSSTTPTILQAAKPAISSTGSTPQQQQPVPQRNQVSSQAINTPQAPKRQQAASTTNNSIAQPKSSWIGWTFKWFVQKPVEWLLIKPIKWLFNIK